MKANLITIETENQVSEEYLAADSRNHSCGLLQKNQC
jgi:hypothetical protein